MRFEDEHYVRVYTRNTPTLKLVGWQGRAVLWELMRVVDKAGLLDVGDDAVEAIAAATDVPPEIVGPGLAAIRRRGVVEVNDGVLCIPRFIEGQTAKQSDKARKAKERETARALARKNGPSKASLGEDGRPAPGPHEPTLYFVQAGPGGPIKIGTTRDLRQRLWALSAGHQEPLALLAFTPGDAEAEAALHERFAHLRTKGEWFAPGKELTSHIEVTIRDFESHTESHGVRRSHSDLSHTELSRAEQREEIPQTPFAAECSEPEPTPASPSVEPAPETPRRPDAPPGAAAGAPRADEPSPPPEPQTESPEAEDGPPEPKTGKQRMAESKARIAEAFAKGVRAATGDAHFALLAREHDDLGAVCVARGKGPDGKRLVGPKLDAWLEERAAAFARETRAESKFYGLGPSGFERWLRQKANAATAPASGQFELVGNGKAARRVDPKTGYVQLRDRQGLPVQGYDPNAPWLRGVLSPAPVEPAEGDDDTTPEARRATG